MALRKLLTKERLFNGVKRTFPFTPLYNAIVTSPSLQQTIIPPNASKTSFHREYLSSPVDRGFFRRFVFRPAVYHSGTGRLPDFLSLPVGENLREKLVKFSPARSGGNEISVENARKILRALQMEKVKVKLRDIPENSVSYGEFLRICVECCQNDEQGAEFAKILDDSGNVIVLGNDVFLRPDQVAKTIESLIHRSLANPNDPRRKELMEMEKQKAMIDEKAKAQVRTELYCGLGFLTIQTLGLMRLTFWELNWDVMEPICFFITSLDFGFAYLFFLRTSTEPTFQGYFRRRFIAKLERLMKTHDFDINRYNELCNLYYPSAKCESSQTPREGSKGIARDGSQF